MTKVLLDRPIFIIGCNRSGTTLLFRNLSEHPRTWSLYEEAQHVFHRHYPIDPDRGERIAEPPARHVAEHITHTLYREAHNKEVLCDIPVLGRLPRKLLQRPVNRLYKRPPIRLVEKTPANCLRIPLLAELFPDALFVYLMRKAEDVISSLMEGWKIWSRTGTGRWTYSKWHYLAPPGWQRQTAKSLEEICAFQWVEANRIAWEDLKRSCPDRFMLVRHEDATAEPMEWYERLLDFCQLPRSDFFTRQVARAEERVFTHRGSNPRPEKWRQLHYQEVERVRPLFQSFQDQFYPPPSGP